jgi:hypothetical protein
MGTALSVFLAYATIGAVAGTCAAMVTYTNWRNAEDSVATGLVVGLLWPVIVIAAPIYLIFSLAKELIE